MSITTQVIIKDGITEPLERFGKKMPKMLDSILYTTGYKYRVAVRKDALAGQILYSRPNIGPLWVSMFVGKKRGARHTVVIGAKKITRNIDLGVAIVKRTYGDATKLANIFEHPGGYTILPKKGKYLTFQINGEWVRVTSIHGEQRPFLSQIARTFNWPAAIDASSEKVITKELRKEGLK